MDPYITISLVDYIHLLHKGHLDRSLYDYFKTATHNCSAAEVNIAIENLILRYKDVELIENTVARFIRAAAAGLDKQNLPDYPSDSVFSVLERENEDIQGMLSDLKSSFIEKQPALKTDDQEVKELLFAEIQDLERIKIHYYKLQYGVFSALEEAAAPTQCIKLMWHLEDTVWPRQKNCLELLKRDAWDFKTFNRVYGQMFFTLGSLLYRERRILYPVAAAFLPGTVQKKLISETESYGVLSRKTP